MTIVFDQAVPDNGYRWWYVDALSADGAHGLTIIAFVGSVFSPYYRWARRRGQADPLDHCAVNVALYGRGGHRWAMTERGQGAVTREAGSLRVGRSRLEWTGTALEIVLDELTVPLPGRIRGRIRLEPRSRNDQVFTLDGEGLHQWRPIAPTAAVEVRLDRPAHRWQGHGYLDSNWGAAPLEAGFTRWDWSRAAVGDGAVVLYEGRRRDASNFSLALYFDRTGRPTAVDPPPLVALPRTRIWRIPRFTRAEHATAAGLRATLEDTPFYARSVLETRLLGEAATAVHESLELDRFTLPVVQAMLPFRMPRRAG